MADKDDDYDDLAHRARADLKEWDTQYGDWAQEARECYSMLHGDQWTMEDAEKMQDQKRPMVTMNRIAAMVRGVCGLEVSQRQEVRYLAPEQGDTKTIEIQNAAAKWVREQCAAEDEESEAFRDLITAGFGWTETRVDFEESPEGKLVIERVDPLEMRWDAFAGKKGLQDSRWRARLKKMDVTEVKRLWPGKADDIAAYVEDPEGLASSPHVTSAGDDYNGSGRPAPKDEAVVMQYQYWVHVSMARVRTPNGQVTDMSEKRLAQMAEAGVTLEKLADFRQREYRQAIICGPVTLEDKPLRTSFFTLNVMTGVRDRNKGYFYGLVRDLCDPQRWSNKFFATIIDIVSTNAKGGVMAETSAVEDPRRFEEDWSNPRSTVWLKTGGLAKIQSREPPQIPAAIAQMMEFAVGSLPHISGINLEFLGTPNRDQPGVVEQSRKQAVANSLAEFFSAMRQYRKVQGKVMLELIHEYIADGRLIRIVGKQGEQYVPLVRQSNIEYDVVVDEAPTAPDRKLQTWMALGELLPMALKAGMPIPPEVLDYSPLPSTLAQTWKELLNKAPKVPEQVQQQMEQMQQQMQKLTQENAALKDKKQEAAAELSLEQQKTQAQMTLEQRQAQHKMQLAEQEAAHEARMTELEFRMEQEREERKAALEEWKITKQAELDLRKQQHAESLAAQKVTEKGD
jgi:hypothetical protein